MCSAAGLQTSLWRGCPIRTSADHSLLATPRGLSQPSTSFVGCWCQGIHRAPLLARNPDRSIATTSEPAGSCSIFGIHHELWTPSIAIDSSSLLCSCPGASSQAHRLSSGAPTLGSVQPTTTGQPRHPNPGRQKCGPPRTLRVEPQRSIHSDGHAYELLLATSSCCLLCLYLLQLPRLIDYSRSRLGSRCPRGAVAARVIDSL